MTQTAWLLSLTQFYLALGFMLFFMVLELGLAWVLFALRLRARRTGAGLLVYRFWVRVFALCLVLGFAAGLPLLMQLGTLWPRFMDRAGEVAGPLVALAILSAFVFKSCFLGAMLYGQRRLADGLHTFAVGMVALGSAASLWWISVLLAWLQHPAGTLMSEGRYQIVSWQGLLGGLAPYLFGVLFTGGFVLAAALMLFMTAKRCHIRPSDEGDRKAYSLSLRLLMLALVFQAGTAFLLGQELLAAQPARAAASMAQWSSAEPHRLSLLAWPDEGQGGNAWELHGPDLPAGWVPAANGDAVMGLNDLVGLRPPVVATYFSVRVAVLLFILLAVFAAWAWWRGRRLAYEPDDLSPAGRFGLGVLMLLAVCLQLSLWAYLLLGNLPYAVHGTIALRELGPQQDTAFLWLVSLVQLLVYGWLLYGLRSLLLHTMRHGVVPVGRHRGRA